jgi:hypothetical protein
VLNNHALHQQYATMTGGSSDISAMYVKMLVLSISMAAKDK